MAHTVAATMAPGHVPPLACPSCAAHNRHAASFCGNCGASLAPVTVRDVTRAHIAEGTGPAALACPRCGAHNRQTASFCGGCGVPFAPVPAHETAVAYAAAAPAAAAPTRSLPAWDGWVAVAVLALAAGALIRVFGIDGPAELLPAETAFLDAASDSVRGFPAALWSESTGQPAGYSYLLAGWVELFESSPAAARMLSALLGAASLVAFYVMCQVFFDRRAALFATLMLAFSAWHLWYSSHALPVAGFLLLVLLGTAALLAGMAGDGRARSRRWLLALAAIAFGASAYFHNAFLISAAAVALLWARDLLFADDPTAEAASSARTYLIVTFVVLAPYLAALAFNAGDVWGQAREVWISSSPQYREAGGVMEQGRHALGGIASSARGLLWSGEDSQRLLDPVTGLLAAVGLLVGLRNLSDRRHLMLWGLFACSVLAGGLTVARGSDALLFAAAPAVFAYAGFALHWLLGWMRARAARPVQVGFVAAVFLFVAMYNLTSDYGEPVPTEDPGTTAQHARVAWPGLG